MRTHWLAFMLVPMAYAQTSSKCADLTKFKIPGVPVVITKAATIPASSAPGTATAETSARVRFVQPVSNCHFGFA